MGIVTNHRLSPTRRGARVGVGSALAAAAVLTGAATPTAGATRFRLNPAARDVPALTVEVLRAGLAVPWDIGFLDADRYLVTERSGRLWLGRLSGGALQRVTANFADLARQGEAGLLGLAIDPAFATNRIFYTCQSHVGPNDNRAVRWRLSAAGTSAVRVGAPVISGIPLANIHNGCRVVVGPDGKLWVSTGDAATGTAPQDKTNLGGKILRVNRNGTAPADNPWPKAINAKRRLVWNYGHRNPQGLALRPGTTQLWNVEHGPERDDELNLALKGRNYGWNPVASPTNPTYYQGVPMTDLAEFPDAVPAAWTSGLPTLATSGLGFISGPAWGGYDGVAAIAELKNAGVLAVWLDAAGVVTATAEIPELNDAYGRIRTLRMGPDGALYVLTSNTTNDKILRVTPSSS